MTEKAKDVAKKVIKILARDKSPDYATPQVYRTTSWKTPTETIREVRRIAGAKKRKEWHRLFMSSFMAGVWLGLGGHLAVYVGGGLTSIQANNPGLQKAIFAACFTVGLMFMQLTGSELITGNFMYFTVAVFSNRVSIFQLCKNWFIVWWGNFAGAITTAYFMSYETDLFSHDPWRTYIINLAESKTSQDFGTIVLKGIGCNTLVCLCCYLAVASEDIISKLFAVFFPIFTFVASGYEHVVANGYYITCGIYYGADTDWGEMFYKNLIPTTIGNAIGGGIITGCVNWYLAGMEHKGKYAKTNWLDKILNFYWYYALVRKYIFHRPVEAAEEAALEMEEMKRRAEDGEDDDDNSSDSDEDDDDDSHHLPHRQQV